MASKERDHDEDEEMSVDEDEAADMEGDDDEEATIEDEELPEVPDESIFKLISHEKDVFCLVLSPNGSKLISGGEDDKAYVWNIESFTNAGTIENKIIERHSDSVIKVNFNHNGTLFATADMAGKIFIHDSATCSTLYEIDHVDEDLEWTLWHHSYDILFAGTNKGVVHMFLLTREAVQQSKTYITKTSDACTAGQLLPDGKRILCSYANGSVLLWNLKEATNTGTELHSPCTTLDLHPNMPIAAVGTENGQTSIINTTNMHVASRLGTATNPDAENPAEASVETVKFAPAGFPWVAVGRADGILTIYDYETGQPRHECAHDGMAVVKCEWFALTNDKLRILTACIDGALRGWDARSGEPVFFKCGGGQEIFDFLIANVLNKTVLFAACAKGVIRVYDYVEGVPENEQEEEQ